MDSGLALAWHPQAYLIESSPQPCGVGIVIIPVLEMGDLSSKQLQDKPEPTQCQCRTELHVATEHVFETPKRSFLGNQKAAG